MEFNLLSDSFSESDFSDATHAITLSDKPDKKYLFNMGSEERHLDLIVAAI